MLFIEIEGRSSPRFQLEFHPRVTIVSGVSAAVRERLVSTLRALLNGQLTEQSMSLDIGNGWDELSVEMLQRLSLPGKMLPFVLSAADLPGVRLIENPAYDRYFDRNRVAQAADAVENHAMASAGPLAWSVFDQEPEDGNAMRQALEGSPLHEAQQALIAAEDRVNDLNRRLQALRAEASRDAEVPAEVIRAYETIDRVETRVAELEAQERQLRTNLAGDAAGDVANDRLERLRQIETAINERLAELQSQQGAPGEDTAEVEACIDAVSRFESGDDISLRREHLERLIAQYEVNRAEVEELERRPRSPEWLLSQTKDQMNEAQARIIAFTYQIEEGIDVRKQLRKAQQQLREAQEAWEELGDGVAAALLTARASLESVVAELRALLALDPGIIDVAAAARAEQRRLVAVEDPRPALVEMLARHGMQVSFDNAVAVATRWVAAQDRLRATNESVQEELAEMTGDLDECRSQIASMEAEQVTPSLEAEAEVLAIREELVRSRHTLDEALQVVAVYQHSQERPEVEAKLARLEMLYEKAWEEAEAAGRKVDYYAKLDALRPRSGDERPQRALDPSSDAYDRFFGSGNDPWWERVQGANTVSSAPDQDGEPVPPEFVLDFSGVEGVEVEKYILSRLAEVRSRTPGGLSVPLVLDAAFDDLDQITVSQLLTSLGKVSSMVQVIYLSSTEAAERWVRVQDERLAAQVFVRYE